VAAAGGAELDGRDARLQERDRVRGAVAADRQRLVVQGGGDRVAQRAHERVGPRHASRRALEGLDDLHVVEGADVREDLVGVLGGQVADVDVHRAAVGHLVERVTAEDPRDVDRGAIEEVRGLPAEA
jgi:hypothetical protein